MLEQAIAASQRSKSEATPAHGATGGGRGPRCADLAAASGASCAAATAADATLTALTSALAAQAIAEGKPIRYEGVIGPVAFDANGDITGPFRLWQIVDGEVTTIGEMSTDDVNAIKAAMQ